MRVLSLVPSWTETLYHAGIELIGRTRYCIHPRAELKKLPIVGGTKEVHWDKIQGLEPDLIILDKEENPLEFAAQCPCPFYASHVDSLDALSRSFAELAGLFENSQLADWGSEWAEICRVLRTKHFELQSLPALGEFFRPVEDWSAIKTVLYLIWKRPWMTVGRETFIFEMLSLLGAGEYVPAFDQRYPEVSLDDYDPSSTLLLLSSEPFPFAGKREQVLAETPHACALIDGESYSWFGVRALRFLQSQAKPSREY